MILTLLFFLPVGYVLLWRSNVFSKKAKWLISAIYGPVVILGIADANNSQAAGREHHKGGNRAIVIESPYSSAVDGLPKVEARVKGILKDAFGSQLKTAEVVPQAEGGYYIRAIYREQMKGAIDAETYKGIIERNMAGVYQRLFTSGLPIRRAELAAEMANLDRFGNDIDTPVFQTALNEDDAKRVRWDRTSELNFSEIWETKFIHPDLR